MYGRRHHLSPHQGTLRPWLPGAGAAKTASHSNTAANAATRDATGTAPDYGAANDARLHPDGKRQRRKVSGQTKAAVIDKLRDLHTQLDKGITPKAGYVHYTVRQAADDWLAHGLDGRSPKTITKNQNVLAPILKVIGARKLRELTTADVRQALAEMAAGYSSAAVSMGHLALKRAIRHAEANNLVPATSPPWPTPPKARTAGRPSR